MLDKVGLSPSFWSTYPAANAQQGRDSLSQASEQGIDPNAPVKASNTIPGSPAPKNPPNQANKTKPAEGSGESRQPGKGQETADKKASVGGSKLTPEEEKMVRELKTIDSKVRQHEQAHIAAGGRYVTGGATYQYQRGPDGQNYAIGGEVQISTSSERTPEETISKAQTVRRAALAPADPSPQDRAVAAAAAAMEISASQEKAQESQAKSQTPSQPSGETDGTARTNTDRKDTRSSNRAETEKGSSDGVQNTSRVMVLGDDSSEWGNNPSNQPPIPVPDFKPFSQLGPALGRILDLIA